MEDTRKDERIEACPAPPAKAAAGLDKDADWEARLSALRLLTNSDARSALEQAREALEALRGQERLDLEARLLELVGRCHLRFEQAVEAAVQLHRAVDLAQQVGRADLEAHSLAILGYAHASMSAFTESVQCHERALSLHKTLPKSDDSDSLLAVILSSFGSTYLFMGLPDKAVPLYRQSSDLFYRLGRGREGAAKLGNCAMAEVTRAEQLWQQSSEAARVQARVAAQLACALAAQVVADPSLHPEDHACIEAHLTRVRALAIDRDLATALEELDLVDACLNSEAHRAAFSTDRKVLRARLLWLSGRTGDAMVALHSQSQGELPDHDRLRVLQELVSVHEAAGQSAGALRHLQSLHELTLKVRDHAAEQRAQVLQAQVELERAQHKAEVERLRAEDLMLRNVELARLATMDALTGLPNRRDLDAALAHRLGDERAMFIAQFACVMVDIDHFKQINDRYSHPVGDEVLRHLGAVLRQALRDGDVAARYGGEEFSLLLDRLDEQMAAQGCERLRTTIASYPWGQIAAGLTVTVSLGVTMRRPSDSAITLLARADACLYAAKTAGRNRVMVDASGEPPLTSTGGGGVAH